MELYGRDLVFGEFRASDYQCYLASFSSTGEREEETGIAVETIEEFIADNPVPVYLGQRYEQKLKPSFVLTKDSCVTTEDYFSEYDCRAILRLITGQRGYQWMHVITDDVGEDIAYRARVTSISYQKLAGRVVGIIVNMECDSQFAWSQEQIVTISAKVNQPFYIYSNSDDLFSYIYPYVEVIPLSGGTLEVRNEEDNNWLVKITMTQARETIRYDCQREIIDGSRNDSGQAMVNYLNNSNCHFFRLLPGRNTFVSNINAQFTFRFREPRKVAFVNI